MIELLAVTDDPRQPEPPVRAVPAGAVTVLCAPAEERDLTPEALWRREAVIERLMEDRDLLPVRFGTVVEDERAAAAAVAGRDEQLAAGLARVRGAVELAVRAKPADGAADPEDPAAYMARAELARKLHERLAAAAREAVHLPGRDLLRGAYLVDRDGVDAFVALVRELQQEQPELLLLCTGPWPPYSFAREGRP